jgi:hypothetical protein
MLRRLLCLVLALGLAPGLTGCVEDAKAKDQPKAEEKAKADPSAPADGKKRSKSGVSVGDDEPPTDPLQAEVLNGKKQLAEVEEDLLERLDELRLQLTAVKGNPTAAKASTPDLLDAARDVRRSAVRAGETIAELEERSAEAARGSKHLAAAYKAAAGLYRQKARDYSERKLREQLNAFAADYEREAKLIPARNRALQEFAKTLPQWRGKVREAVAFLDDTVLYLDGHPRAGAGSAKRYTEALESFAVTFSEWLRTLEAFREAFREQAVSASIQEAYRKDVVVREAAGAARRDEIARAERAKREEAERLAKASEVPPAPPATAKPVPPPEPPTVFTAGVPVEAPQGEPVPVAQPVVYTCYQSAPPPAAVCPPACPVVMCPPVVCCSAPVPCRGRVFQLFPRW